MIEQMIIKAFTKDFITKIYFHLSWLYEMLWGKNTDRLTDKETDESWELGHIYNMKNQFWAVGWTGL